MITPTGYLGILRAHWFKLFALAVFGAIIGLLGQLMQPTEYTANRLLVVNAHGGQSLTDLSQGTSYAGSRAGALAYVGNTDNFLFESLGQLTVDPSIASKFRVQAGVPADTTFIEVNAQAPTLDAAVGLARMAAQNIIVANKQFSSIPVDSTQPALDVRDITPVPVQSQAWPIGLPKWLLPFAGVTLLPLIGFFLFVLRNAIRPILGEAVALEEIVLFPILGTIPYPRDQQLEDIRSGPQHKLAITRYALMDTQAGGRVIAFVGVEGPSDYRPALAMAQALALMDRRVIVGDADFGEPSMDPSSGASLATALEAGGELPCDEHTSRDSVVRLLPTSKHSGATRLLLSPQARELINRLRQNNDFIFLIGPSPFGGPEAAAIASLSDEVVLIADENTPVDLVVDAGRSFPEGSVTGLLILDRSRPRWTVPGRSVAARTQGSR